MSVKSSVKIPTTYKKYRYLQSKAFEERYELLKEEAIGSGSYGDVFHCKQKFDKKEEVAIKVQASNDSQRLKQQM